MGISLPSKSKSGKSSPWPIKLEFHLLEIKDCQSAEICQDAVQVADLSAFYRCWEATDVLCCDDHFRYHPWCPFGCTGALWKSFRFEAIRRLDLLAADVSCANSFALFARPHVSPADLWFQSSFDEPRCSAFGSMTQTANDPSEIWWGILIWPPWWYNWQCDNIMMINI